MTILTIYGVVNGPNNNKKEKNNFFNFSIDFVKEYDRFNS